MDFEPVIGLEVHVQLKTNTKLFCSCPTEFGTTANTNTCPICTGQPGVLPVINKKAVELSVKTAAALNCTIHEKSVFARKSYFYPDLPKNYQISQYEQPLSEHGKLMIKTGTASPKQIGITRIHLEEDAGKLLHAIGSKHLDYSLVDFNRTGIPLLEIVSEPDINSPDEAYDYLTELKQLLQYIEVSDCDMEKGYLRCDANVSVHVKGDKLGTRTELKNMNSFKAVRDALEYEITRQTAIVKSGGKIVQETLLWHTDTNMTESMRSKEEAHDYRYFPEPDLMPLVLDPKTVTEIENSIIELPQAKKIRFMTDYGLTDYDAGVITQDKNLASYYEKTVSLLNQQGVPAAESTKPAANWITTDLLGKLNAANKQITESPVSEQNLAGLVLLIVKGTISSKIAKTVFDEMFTAGKEPGMIVKEKGLVQISDESVIRQYVTDAVNENAKSVEEYKAGKEKALGAIVGAIMKKSQGKANPQIVNKLLKEILG
jgi:aspartyl-tRNA(Asn)/glutamyl-tRNA(Gln) amidotransferase subunit B